MEAEKRNETKVKEMPRTKTTNGAPFVLSASTWTGERVRKLRDTFELTQQDLSEMTGGNVSHISIANWERKPGKSLTWAYCYLFDQIENKLEKKK